MVNWKSGKSNIFTKKPENYENLEFWKSAKSENVENLEIWKMRNLEIWKSRKSKNINIWKI